MKIILKKQKGFASSDLLIALLIIVLFAGLIATISYNIYLSNSSIKRMSKATGYIVDVFEHIDKINYEDVTKENLVNYFNNKYYYQQDGITPRKDSDIKIKESDEDINTPFKAEINIVKYSDTDNTLDTEGLDVIQEITMTVKYRLGNKDQEVTMTRNKTRE